MLRGGYIRFGGYETKEEVEMGAEVYREKIIGMIEQIQDMWVLEQIYRCIVNMVKED